MKHLLLILLLTACANQVPLPDPAKPETSQSLKAEIVSMFDGPRYPHKGVNYMYRYGGYIHALKVRDMLTPEDGRKFCEALAELYLPDGRKGFYRYYDLELSDDVMKRDDYWGVLLAIVSIRDVNDCVLPHLEFIYMAMTDQEVGQPDIGFGLYSSIEDESFIKLLVSIYKSTVIEGLELEGDVWSPVHQVAFKRAYGIEGDYWFWDMVGYYAQTKPIVKKPIDDNSDKILLAYQFAIQRGRSPSYWSQKSDAYLHEQLDMNGVLDIYYNPSWGTSREDELIHKLLEGTL